MSTVPFPLETRAIVSALLRLPKTDQRQFMALAIEFLRRESFTDVTSISDFLAAPPSALVSDERRAQLLGQVAKAIRENDQGALRAAE